MFCGFGFVVVGLSLGAGGHGLQLSWCAKPLVSFGFGASRGDTLCGICFWSLCKGSVIENHTFFVSVYFCVLWIWLSLGAGGHGLKLLWCAKPFVYCGFGASKGDTLCGIVVWCFCKGSVIENHTFVVSVSFVFGFGFVFGILCTGAAGES